MREELQKSEQIKFTFFNAFFKEYHKYKKIENTYLLTYGGPTSDYYTDLIGLDKKLNEVTEKFVTEITQNVIKLETNIKVELYLERIQSKVSEIYEILKEDKKHELFQSQNFSRTIVTVQKLIADIASKRDVSNTERGIIENTNSASKKHEKKDKDVTKYLWFEVGFRFATGEMQKLLEEHNNNCTKIAKILGNVNYRPYITDSIASSNGGKNIYRYPSKLKDIQKYCEERNINMTEEFLMKIKSIEN